MIRSNLWAKEILLQKLFPGSWEFFWSQRVKFKLSRDGCILKRANAGVGSGLISVFKAVTIGVNS